MRPNHAKPGAVRAAAAASAWRYQERLVVGLLWSLLAALIVLALAAPASAGGLIAADEAHRQSQAGELLIVDVRSPREWRQTGLPKGAAAVTIHDPNGPEGFLVAMLSATGGDKARPIALICASGVRSNRAHRFLETKGFTSVVDVSEGMLGRRDAAGWLKRGLPTEPCKTC